MNVSAEYDAVNCEPGDTDSCSFVVDECLLTMTGCPPSGELVLGDFTVLEVEGRPTGGDFTWTVLESPSSLTFAESPSGATLTTTDVSAGEPPGHVEVKVEYTVNGCTRTRLCIFDVVYSDTNDEDGDGLTDFEEGERGTDPLIYDTDGDGYDDWCEVNNGVDPLDSTSPQPTDPVFLRDRDQDGLSNFIEDCGGTDPDDPDTDDDGLTDGFENDSDDLDPADDDSDGDGVPDGQEDNDGDGLNNQSEQNHGSDPDNPDTDGDGASDGDEVDQGSFPTDDSDGGQPPPASEAVRLTLTIGDDSGSASERWSMTVGPTTLTGPTGGLLTETYTFLRNQSYPITIHHLGTTLPEPDFDYLATIRAADESQIGWRVDDPEGILGRHHESTVNFAEGKSATLVFDSDLGLDSDNDGQVTTDDDGVEDESPGKVLLVNDDDDNANGTPDQDDPPGSDDDDLAVMRVLPPGPPQDPAVSWWRLTFPTTVAVYRNRDRSDPIESFAQNAWPPPETVYVEGLAASQAPGDVSIELRVQIDDLPWQDDTVRATVVELDVDTVAEVSVDEPFAFASAVFSPFIDADLSPAVDGLPIEFQIARNGAAYRQAAGLIENGAASAMIPLQSIAADVYSVTARFAEFERTAAPFSTTPGAPADAQVSVSPSIVYADATTEGSATVTLVDQYGNFVADDTAVTLTMSEIASDAPAPQMGGAVIGGSLNATFAAPTVSSPEDDPAIEIIAAPISMTASIGIAQVPGSLAAGSSTLDIGAGASTTVSLNTSAADGAPVFWTVSNGSDRIRQTTVADGTSSIQVTAADVGDGRTRVGPCVVTATVGDALFSRQLWFTDSRSFHLESERSVLSGDVLTDGVAELTVNEADAIPNNPPVVAPEVRSYPYYATSDVTIHGAPLATYSVNLVDPADGALVDLVGVEQGLITTDSTGRALFTIASTGSFSSLHPHNIQVRVRELSFTLGADPEERVETFTIVEHTAWTRTWDWFSSFFGGDPDTAAGVASNMAGGMLIVGDVGSLVKNGWRAVGFSEKPPDLLETSLSGAGLLTEVAVGAGEVVDAPISAVRAVVAAVGKGPLANVLVASLRSSVEGVAAAGPLVRFTGRLTRGVNLQAVENVATSEDLVRSLMRATDRLGPQNAAGDLGDVFLQKVAQVGVNESLGGALAAQRLVKALGDPGLSDAVIAALRGVDQNTFEVAMVNLARAMDPARGGLDPALVRQVLNHDALFTEAFTRADLLTRLGRIAPFGEGAELADRQRRYRAVVQRLKSPVDNFANGAKYELVVADHLRTFAGFDEVTHVSKFIKVSDPVTGLKKTDIDAIAVKDGVTHFIQAKTSAQAVTEEAARRWVEIVRQYAEGQGITNFKIVYVTPNGIPPMVQQLFNKLEGLTIETLPVAAP